MLLSQSKMVRLLWPRQRRSDVRRHATLPQSWIQRENWEFETHRIDPAYYTAGMAMGRRTDRARTPGLWIAANELPTTGGHPFYQRLHQVLDAHGFDAFVESQCAPFYADGVGRPSLTPGTYFRLLLIGYFEGLDSERGIAWRTADSLALRGFLGLGLDEVPPEHSTISRTRRLIAGSQSPRRSREIPERLLSSPLLPERPSRGATQRANSRLS